MSNKYAEISKVKIRTLNKNGKTILDDVYFTSPFKVAPPFYKSDDFIKVIIMSSSAGTLEGDVQEYDITLGDNTKMELTSQSFEKIHTMIDEEATRDCDIYIGKNSFLRYNLLPTIPFKDSAFKSNINIKFEDSSSKLIFMDIINCGRVAHGEKFEYKYYKSYVEVECDNKLVYVDNTNYNPKEMDIENFGMYEESITNETEPIFTSVYEDIKRKLVERGIPSHEIAFIHDTNNNEVLNTIRDILKNSNVEGAASITQYNYISIKILGYNSDKLMQVSDKISEYLMDLDVN